MPANFPGLWLKRVEANLTRADRAPWLNGITELDVPVIVSGSGDISELNLIHIPTTDFEPEVFINNTAYPLALVDYTDDEVIVKLDKYQTAQTSISDDAIIGSSYNKIDAATTSHTTAILKKKYSKAIHSIAPAGNTAATPVLVSTGRTGKFKADGTEIIKKTPGGRLMLTYLDLVDFRAACVAAGFDMDGVRLVLCDDHWNDLLVDRENFGDQLVNYKSGEVAPVILGFKIYNYVNNPNYNGTNKLAYGAIPTATQYKASIAFQEANIAVKTGLTKQYFSIASGDTGSQTNKLNYRHYFMAVPKRLKYIAAITSGIAA
ncbi:phage major capsid protein [Mucilaginibacter glaciei]|uniref:Uncharacterized protein n=1 Tax=Mucilaginibacter glaciei TaxID=2772109 RepID=A0A926NN76_9SPHI|nr:hypothetical protein [Mucilaginibacter glaciei]MBD1394266.1 hypothetical protein [Mucilaginibacter glaciei]